MNPNEKQIEITAPRWLKGARRRELYTAIAKELTAAGSSVTERASYGLAQFASALEHFEILRRRNADRELVESASSEIFQWAEASHLGPDAARNLLVMVGALGAKNGHR